MTVLLLLLRQWKLSYMKSPDDSKTAICPRLRLFVSPLLTTNLNRKGNFGMICVFLPDKQEFDYCVSQL